MADDPRVLVLTEMRRQTALLEQILEALYGDDEPAAEPAPTVNLDGPHGDPLVKAKDPRDWTGEPMTGRKFSECPADYLDLVAERLDYFNTKEDDEKKRRYNTLDAARARGWAARIRGGHRPPVAEPTDARDTEPTW